MNILKGLLDRELVKIDEEGRLCLISSDEHLLEGIEAIADKQDRALNIYLPPRDSQAERIEAGGKLVCSSLMGVAAVITALVPIILEDK